MKKKLLIIEDERHIRETLSDILTIYNYDVYQAQNGLEGLKQAREVAPDVILCDLNMPGSDGMSVLQTLKDERRLEKTAFVFLSANAAYEQLKQSIQAGADDYLTKPVYSEILIERLKQAEDKKLVNS